MACVSGGKASVGFAAGWFSWIPIFGKGVERTVGLVIVEEADLGSAAGSGGLIGRVAG